MTPAARVQAAIELLDEIAEAARGGGAAADTLDRALFQDAALCRLEGPARGARAGLRRDPAGGRAAGIGRAAMLGLARERPELAGAVRRLAARAGADRGRRAGGGQGHRAGLAAGAVRSAGFGRRAAGPAGAGAARPPGQPAQGHARRRAGRCFRRRSRRRTRRSACACPRASGSRRPTPGDRAWSRSRTRGASSSASPATRRRAMLVVDLCAGAGGKTLALAAEMGGQGRILACDTDRGAAFADGAAARAGRRRRSSRRGCSIRAGRRRRWPIWRAGRSRAGRRALLGHRHLAAQSRDALAADARAAGTADRAPGRLLDLGAALLAPGGGWSMRSARCSPRRAGTRPRRSAAVHRWFRKTCR